MYRKIKCNNKEDYFKPLSQRNGVYFCCFIGFDEELLLWERKLQIDCQKNGTYIYKRLSQPDGATVTAFFDKIGTFTFEMKQELFYQLVTRWLDFISQTTQKNIAEAMFTVLSELKESNINILKNIFVKLMCWLKTEFKNVLFHLGEQAKILYEGEVSKHEIFMLKVLCFSGCDIAYVNFEKETDFFKGYDRIYGKRRGQPPKHFKEIDLKALQKQQEMKEKIASVSTIIQTNDWLQGNFWKAMFQTNSQRMDRNHYYNFFIQYIGIDEKEAYQNRLYELHEDCKQKGKPFVIEEEIKNPSIEESNRLRLQRYETKKDILQQLSEKIVLLGNDMLQNLLQRAFFIAMEEYQNTLPKIYNTALKLVCWLNRYSNRLLEHFDYETLPLFLYYGEINESQILFLNLLSYLPVDVLYVSPVKIPFESKNSRLVELPQNSTWFPFPKKAIKIKQATTAYQAEKELDTLLYTDTGLYRQRQFTRSCAVTLKTIYDEIFILWKEEAKYRPGFEIKNNVVTIPNIFAKINGVKNEKEYVKNIAELLTEDTIFIKNFPYIAKIEHNPSVSKLIKNGKILMEDVKKQKEYPYDFLNLETQDYLLEKAQEMIDLHWIAVEGIESILLSLVLRLDKITLQMIQQFDFTKEIPKVIVISVNETMATLEDAVYLLFLNLVGFDIVVFTPTGYRNIEKYIPQNAFEPYEVGEYLFHMEIPERAKLERMAKSMENSLLSRLFGRRK